MNNFLEFYQHIPEKLSPILLDLGFIQIRYYGLMYIVAFLITLYLVKKQIKDKKLDYIKIEDIDDIFFISFLFAIIGGRFGYVLFYNLGYYIQHPIEIISPFSIYNGHIKFHGIAGMSYHGGLLGVILGLYYSARKKKINFWKITDLIAPSFPLGYTFGRIANFINNELYGRVTTSPIGMYFKTDPTHSLRHPSQLYEAFFEGIVLFVILWKLKDKKLPVGFLSGAYVFGYGLFRFFIEFFREPDPQVGFILKYFTMGQILCSVMMISGIIIMYLSKKQFFNKT